MNRVLIIDDDKELNSSQAQNHFHDRSFPGSIASKQAKDTALFNMKINRIDRHLFPIDFCQAFRFNYQIIHIRFPRFPLVCFVSKPAIAEPKPATIKV